MPEYSLTHDEVYGLIEAVDHGLDDRQSYLQDGNPDTDYGEEWPEIAREEAWRWRNCASALRKLGGPSVGNVQGEFHTMAESCDSLALSLEASADEYRNPAVGN